MTFIMRGKPTIYRDTAGNYQRVGWDDEGGGLFSSKPYRCWITAGGKQIGEKVKNGDAVSYHGKLYTRENTGSVDRIVALRTAVNAFIDSVANQKDSKGNAIANRISIVKFAGTKIDWNGSNEGNETYKEDGKTYNYSQVVKGLTAASTEKDALKNAVNGLSARGATAADYGMELAKSVLDGRTETKPNKSVVIMFTDGEPNHQNGFDSQVASDAIAAAKTLKGGGTLVYTIGIFNGANPSSTADAINKYMHAMSSNYPAASYVDKGYDDFWGHHPDWKWYLGNRAENSNYYLAATNAGDLDDVFQAISQEIGSLKEKVDASSVLSDTLSDMFTFNPPAGAVNSGIKVYKQPVKADGTDDVDHRTELTKDNDGVEVTVSDKKLEVKGFDYGKNAVTTKTEGSTITYSGCKLVVTIPIKPDPDYHGWADGEHYYDTNSTANDSKAGLEYGETGSRQTLYLDKSPNAPVTGYTVSYAYKPGAKPDNADALLPSGGVYIEGQEYNLKTTPSADGWTFTGWLDSSDKEVTGKQTMGTEPVTYYGKWEQNQPGVSVEKTAKRIRNGIEEDLPSGTGTVRVDDTIKYTVKATNTGNVELRNVSILECFGGRNKFEDDKTKQKVSGLFDRYGFTIAQTLAPGATATRTFTYVVTDADEDHGEIKNHLSMQEATYFDGQKDAKIPSKTAPSHEVKVEKPHGVTYEFEAGLPDKLQEYLPNEDLGRYYKGDSVDVLDPKQKSATIDNTNYTFAGWYVNDVMVGDSYTMDETDVTFVGKWTKEEQQPETATLRFEFKSGTDGKDLPASDMPPVPNDVTEEVGTAVQLTNYTATVDDNNGKWSFDGWYTDDNLSADSKITGDTYPMPVNGGTLYGKWTFTENTPEPQPGLSVDKKAYLVGEGDETTEITSTTKVRPGDTIQYVITIRNTGNTVLNNLTVRDAFTAAAADDLVIEGGVLPENATLAKGGEIEIKATYVVQDNDVTVKNKVTVTTADVNGEDEVITDIDRGDVDGYEVSGWIKKIVESKKGTFKKDASFTFDIWADEACTDRLKTIAISKEWAVTKDDYDVEEETFSFGISENNFNKLNEENGHKVIYVTEREGDIKGMTYDSDVVTMYLRRSRVVVNSLNIVGSYEATTNPMLDVAAPAEFTNVYKKPADKGETIKSGPQLNRDDHVAYIMGYPDGTVQPEGQITRAEACTIFFRLLTDSSRDYYFARTNDYSDVNRGDWFNNAISTLSNAGIVTGYNDGTFRPNQPITRGEMAKIIANFANLKSGGKTFTDLAGHWSKSYVELAAGNGWIAGYPDGSFRPDQKITRAETVTMINRVLDRVPAKESRLLSRSIMLTFPDNKPGDWYYIAIQEASNSHEYQRSVYETTGDEMWTKLIDNVDWTKLEK